MTDIKPHALIIHRDLDVEYGPSVDIECPGVTEACRMWVECRTPECPGSNGGDDTLHVVSPIAHGVEHRHFDEGPGGYWGIRSDECYALDHGHAAGEEFADEHHLGTGRHEVFVEVDETTVIFTLATRHMEASA